MKLLSPRKQETAIKFAIFNARMEGFRVPESVILERRQVLEGKITADDLVRQYKVRYAKRQSQ